MKERTFRNIKNRCTKKSFTALRAIALTLAVVLILAGCSFSTTADYSQNVAVEKKDGLKNEKQKLVFFLRAATKDSVTGSLVKRYNQENHDGVEVAFEVFGENYRNVVMVALAAGTPPDVFELNGGMTVPQLAQADYIMPVDRYVTEDFKKGLYPEVLTQKQFYYGGRLYTIPERAAFFRLMYNKELFRKAGLDAPPKTLEELYNFADIITRMGNGEYYGFGVALKTTSSFSRFTDNICAIAGLTGEAGFDWNQGRFDFMKQKRPLEFLIKMGKDGVISPDSINLDLEVMRLQFAQGKFAMIIDGNWQPAVYNNKELPCEIEWDSAPIPVFSDMPAGKSFIWYDMGKLIAKRTGDPQKAWNFIQFLLDNQQEFVAKGEPLRTVVAANDQKNIPLEHMGIKGFSDIESSRAFPFQVHNYLTKLEGSRYDKVYQDIFIGKMPLMAGLEDLTRRYNAALEKEINEGILKEEDLKFK